MKGMHDNPALFPTLPGREMSATDREVMVEPNRGTQWERCWEYVLTHDLTEAEGSAFWHGANLAAEDTAATFSTPKPKRSPNVIEIDRAAVAAALAATAEPQIETRGSNTLPATGHCHTCDRRVSGERRFCGRCSARRSR